MYAASFKIDNDSGPDFACLSNFLITVHCPVRELLMRPMHG